MTTDPQPILDRLERIRSAKAQAQAGDSVPVSDKELRAAFDAMAALVTESAQTIRELSERGELWFNTYERVRAIADRMHDQLLRWPNSPMVGQPWLDTTGRESKELTQEYWALVSELESTIDKPPTDVDSAL